MAFLLIGREFLDQPGLVGAPPWVLEALMRLMRWSLDHEKDGEIPSDPAALAVILHCRPSRTLQRRDMLEERGLVSWWREREAYRVGWTDQRTHAALSAQRDESVKRKARQRDNGTAWEQVKARHNAGDHSRCRDACHALARHRAGDHSRCSPSEWPNHDDERGSHAVTQSDGSHDGTTNGPEGGTDGARLGPTVVRRHAVTTSENSGPRRAQDASSHGVTGANGGQVSRLHHSVQSSPERSGGLDDSPGGPDASLPLPSSAGAPVGRSRSWTERYADANARVTHIKHAFPPDYYQAIVTVLEESGCGHEFQGKDLGDSGVCEVCGWNSSHEFHLENNMRTLARADAKEQARLDALRQEASS